jgi:hypothetical protein
VVPIEVRIVEEDLQALLVALVGQLAHHVAFEGGPVDDVPIGVLRIEEAKPVVMFGRHRDVAHAGAFGHCNPDSRIELRGVERGRQLLVLADRRLVIVHHPFAVAQLAVDAPMDEQSELGILKPSACLQVLGRRLISRLGGMGLLT